MSLWLIIWMLFLWQNIFIANCKKTTHKGEPPGEDTALQWMSQEICSQNGSLQQHSPEAEKDEYMSTLQWGIPGLFGSSQSSCQLTHQQPPIYLWDLWKIIFSGASLETSHPLLFLWQVQRTIKFEGVAEKTHKNCAWANTGPMSPWLQLELLGKVES